jgi:hypothetical protein
MTSLRFTDVQSRPTEFLDVTSVTLEEFQQLVPPFEAAFQAHMAAWRLDGKPRTARQFTVYKQRAGKRLKPWWVSSAKIRCSCNLQRSFAKEGSYASPLA